MKSLQIHLSLFLNAQQIQIFKFKIIYREKASINFYQSFFSKQKAFSVRLLFPRMFNEIKSGINIQCLLRKIQIQLTLYSMLLIYKYKTILRVISTYIELQPSLNQGFDQQFHLFLIYNIQIYLIKSMFHHLYTINQLNGLYFVNFNLFYNAPWGQFPYIVQIDTLIVESTMVGQNREIDPNSQQTEEESMMSEQQVENEQHEACFFHETRLLYRILNFPKQLKKLDHKLFIVQALNFREYLLQQTNLIPAHQIHLFLECLSHKPTLYKFLQYVLVSAPPLYMAELILIAYRIILLKPLMGTFRDFNQLQTLASDSNFVRYVFSNNELIIFAYSRVVSEQRNVLTEQQSAFLHFMHSYTLTILLVFEDYAYHPAFDQIKQIVQEQMRQYQGIRKRPKKVQKYNSQPTLNIKRS